MRRFLVNGLAVVGALTLLGNAVAWGLTRSFGDATGVVLGPDGQPLPAAPVFLDRGGRAIERFLTDAQGRFQLPLERGELRRAVWLICAPGGVPMIDARDEGQLGPTTYQYTAMSDSSSSTYRARGWRGPIPRECPRAIDAMGWRYPAAAGVDPTAFSSTEPDWTRWDAPRATR